MQKLFKTATGGLCFIYKKIKQNSCLSLWVIPLLGEMSAKQTKGCPFPEEKVSMLRIDGEGCSFFIYFKGNVREHKQRQRDERLALPLGELAKSKILTERAVPSTSIFLKMFYQA